MSISGEQTCQELIDETSGELQRRFSEKNSKLYKYLSIIYSTASPDFMKLESLFCFNFELLGLDIEKVKVERAVFKLRDERNCKEFKEVLGPANELKEAFLSIFDMSIVVLLFGASTAACEHSFSCLKRILSHHWMRMIQERKRNLILMSYESDLTSELNLDVFVEEFRYRY
ncbi:unnamed protein product [Eretmochelys imbricata]